MLKKTQILNNKFHSITVQIIKFYFSNVTFPKLNILMSNDCMLDAISKNENSSILRKIALYDRGFLQRSVFNFI